MAYVGVQIDLKDGSKEWFDPIDEDDFNKMVNNATDKYIIDNGLYQYEFYISDVSDIFTYQLHECCGFDRRSGHGYKCKNLGID